VTNRRNEYYEYLFRDIDQDRVIRQKGLPILPTVSYRVGW